MAFNPILIGDDHVRDNVENNNSAAGGTTMAAAAAAAAATQQLPHAQQQQQQQPPLRTAAASNYAVDGAMDTDKDVIDLLHSSDIPLLTAKTPASTAVRRCLQQYYFDYTWCTAFPQYPAVPLLYYPDAYTELLHDPAAVDVMQCELDAMTEGVLHRIPLSYHLLDVEALYTARAAAQATEQRIAELQQRASAAGQHDQLLTWRAEDVNPLLDDADAALVDAEFDSTLLLQRDLPSLTLMQRPLYTDIGLVPQEQRHAARLARIVPPQLRSLAQEALLQRGAGDVGSAAAAGAPPPPPSSPTRGDGVGAALSLVSDDAEGRDEGGGGGVSSEAAAAAAAAGDDAHAWRQAVLRSFRHAREVDRQYDAFVEQLVECKLGLDVRNDAHVRLARRLWRALFDGTRREQQRDVWCLLCRFSSNYRDDVEEDNNNNGGGGSDAAAAEATAAATSLAARELVRGVAQCAVPHFADVWQPLLTRYAAEVAAYARTLPRGVAQRKEQLRLSGTELDPLYSGGFRPDVAIGRALQRSGNELGDNRTPLPVYPVEVLPVFPSGYDRAAAVAAAAAAAAVCDASAKDTQQQQTRQTLAAASSTGALDFLGEGAEAVRHVTLPGVTARAAREGNTDAAAAAATAVATSVGGSGASGGAHMLVAGTHLLLADDAQDSVARVRAAAAAAAAAATNGGDEGGAGRRDACAHGVGAVSYHMSGHDAFELLLENDANTSSYLLRVMHDAQLASSHASNTSAEDDGNGSRERDVAAGDLAAAAGAANHDGRYCVYDRVGVRADYVKATHASSPPAQRYVVLYSAPPCAVNADDAHAHNNEDSDNNRSGIAAREAGADEQRGSGDGDDAYSTRRARDEDADDANSSGDDDTHARKRVRFL